MDKDLKEILDKVLRLVAIVFIVKVLLVLFIFILSFILTAIF